MTAMVARAVAAGAVSTKPTVRPRPTGLPATIPCSVTGATAVVKDPMPRPGTRIPATIGTVEVSCSPAADAPREVSGNDDVALAGASTGTDPNCGNLPCAVNATTFSRASVDPGTVTKSRAALFATVSPGITSLVAGPAACGSQAPPELPLSQTAAATWPELVCTCSASATEPCTSGAMFSAANWCGATVMPVARPDCRPASVRIPTLTLAGRSPVFIRYSRTCGAPASVPVPTNHMSEPGCVQATTPMPAASDCSASKPAAIEPVAAPGVDTVTGRVAAACLLAGGAAGTAVSATVPVPDLTAADPDGIDMSAMCAWPAFGAGGGQDRVTAVTAAVGGDDGWADVLDG